MKTTYTADWCNTEETISNRYTFDDKTLNQVLDSLVSIDDECIWNVRRIEDGKSEIVAEIVHGSYTIY